MPNQTIFGAMERFAIEDTTWEEEHNLCSQFPHLNLEDKVAPLVGGSDRTLDQIVGQNVETQNLESVNG